MLAADRLNDSVKLDGKWVQLILNGCGDDAHQGNARGYVSAVHGGDRDSASYRVAPTRCARADGAYHACASAIYCCVIC
jgi:hypothetical protein